MKKILLTMFAMFLGASAFAAPQCKAVDPIRRVDGRKNDEKSCVAAGYCWGPTQTMCGSSPCPWCYNPDEMKAAPKGNPASCKPIDELQRVGVNAADVQACNAADACWAPTRVTDFSGKVQPSCYKPDEKTQRCPVVAAPNCVGDIAKGTGQQSVIEDYEYKGASCKRYACKNRAPVKSNAVTCVAKPGKDRVDCRKNEMSDCQEAGCCWMATSDKDASGHVYPWCFKP
jgi:hypothetical protein